MFTLHKSMPHCPLFASKLPVFHCYSPLQASKCGYSLQRSSPGNVDMKQTFDMWPKVIRPTYLFITKIELKVLNGVHYFYGYVVYVCFMAIWAQLASSTEWYIVSFFPLSAVLHCCTTTSITSSSVHTWGSLLCWSGTSPTPNVWVCSFPPHLRHHCSLAPSLNGAPTPHRLERAAHGPQSPSLPSRVKTGSTVCLVL